MENDTKNEVRQARELFDEVRVQALADVLKNSPAPAKKLNRSETLTALLPALRVALERGHTIESLTDVLQAHGLRISARLLTQTMRGKVQKNERDNARKSNKN